MSTPNEIRPLNISHPLVPPGNPDGKANATPLNNNNNPFILGSLSTELLPPVVKIGLDAQDTSKITVDAVVFLDSSFDSIKAFSIYQQSTTCNMGLPQLNVYICYNENGTKTNSYIAYQVNTLHFSRTDSNGNDYRNVQVFLWNEDPITSRGTVTTVQSSDG